MTDDLSVELRDVLLDNLLNLPLDVASDIAGGDDLEECGLLGGEVLTELALPLGDLLNGDGVEL